MTYLSICTFVTLLAIADYTAGHGYLLKPPARGTAWRVGFKAPADYNDMGYNCGGAGTQHSAKNRGRCGVCGNEYSNPMKSNEPGPGNRYASGTIVANYKTGETIDITVKATAFHMGYYEFKLCQNNIPQRGKDASIAITQSCMDRHPLTAADGVSTKFKAVPLKSTHRVKLPGGVQCSACVLQWRYRAGNNWGCDGKKCGNGYGPQEEFWGCADIAIGQSGGSSIPLHKAPPRPQPTQSKPQPTQSKPQPTQPGTVQHNKRPVPGGKTCRGKSPYGSSLDGWCNMNCKARRPYCPPTHCQC